MASLVSIISFLPSLEKLKYVNRGIGYVSSLPCRTSIKLFFLTMHILLFLSHGKSSIAPVGTLFSLLGIAI